MSQSNDKRIENLVSEIASKRRKTNFASTLTLVIGIVAVGLISFYFGYGYTQFQEVTKPATVVSFAKSEFDKNLIDIRKMAETEIKKSAPDWASEISNQFVGNIPEARKTIEEWLKGILDQKLEEVRVITSAKFLDIVKANRPEFERAIKSMASDSGSDEFMNELLPLFEREAGVDIKQGAIQALGMFADLNRQMDRLSAEKNLNEIEQQMRYVLGLVKRLQMQNAVVVGG